MSVRVLIISSDLSTTADSLVSSPSSASSASPYFHSSSSSKKPRVNKVKQGYSKVNNPGRLSSLLGISSEAQWQKGTAKNGAAAKKVAAKTSTPASTPAATVPVGGADQSTAKKQELSKEAYTLQRQFRAQIVVDESQAERDTLDKFGVHLQQIRQYFKDAQIPDDTVRKFDVAVSSVDNVALDAPENKPHLCVIADFLSESNVYFLMNGGVPKFKLTSVITRYARVFVNHAAILISLTSPPLVSSIATARQRRRVSRPRLPTMPTTKPRPSRPRPFRLPTLPTLPSSTSPRLRRTSLRRCLRMCSLWRTRVRRRLRLRSRPPRLPQTRLRSC